MTIPWNNFKSDMFPTADGGVQSVIEFAVTSALPIAGVILGVGIAWKLFKKFTK